MIFASRRRRGSDSLLDWKVRLFFLGAVLALLGLALNSSVLVGLAILVLMGGVGLRFLPFSSKGETGDREDPQG